jgi:GAF domain-containing protein
LQTFADQAVIAIENVRLFTELQTRNRELTEALEQQTATGKILQVISQSQADVQPIFDTIAENALRLLRAWSVAVYRTDGDFIHFASARGGQPGSEKYFRDRSPWVVNRDTNIGRCILDRTITHIPDIESDAGATQAALDAARARGWRSLLQAPMLLDGRPIGLISVTRAAVGSFTLAEIELLKTFANQAVIAVENVRLFTELEARTDALTRSVDQLTALGEVGRAVSSSLDLETVLTTIVSRAVDLSGLDGGVVFEYDEAAEEFVQRAVAEIGGVLGQILRGVRSGKGKGHSDGRPSRGNQSRCPTSPYPALTTAGCGRT